MRSSSLIFIFFNIVFINCQNLRNLILTMDPQKLEKLTELANKTLYQLLGIKMDFEGRGYGKIEGSKHKVEIALYDDQDIPTETKQFRFEINNWSPEIPEVKAENTSLKIFGNIYDIKEQYKIVANLIANSIQNGFVISYEKSGDNILANSRYKCFVNDEKGEKIGSFEIAIEDKNDKKSIIDTIKNWVKNIKKEDVANVLEIIAKASTVFLGVKKDWFSSSSFLNIPYLVLLFILGLL